MALHLPEYPPAPASSQALPLEAYNEYLEISCSFLLFVLLQNVGSNWSALIDSSLYINNCIFTFVVSKFLRC